MVTSLDSSTPASTRMIRPEDSESIRILALIQANAELANKTPAQIALILAKARKDMGGP